MVIPAILFALVLVLAFNNGANDVSKGIATLVGSGVTQFRVAIAWGTGWTLAGALLAAWFSQGLLKAFTGAGFISPVPVGPAFLIAVTGGALIWVWMATRAALPVSTTHSITGALVGAGFIATGANGIAWTSLAGKFFLPLALSPVLALGLIFLLFPLLRFGFAGLQRYCLCLDQAPGVILQPGASAVMAQQTHAVAGLSEECACSPTIVARLNALDSLHWLSAGVTSFARGLNDAPKILALGLAASLVMKIETGLAFALVAVAMASGSLAGGLRVTETLAGKVTAMSAVEGFAANAVTSLLVIAASMFALPVSTTHVSSGAIIGLGLKKGPGAMQWKTVRDMVLAWIVTLPVSALLGALLYWIAARLLSE
jgi:inorganic phosphate transporter, PiT family